MHVFRWCTVENLLELPCLNRLLFVLLQAQIMLGMVKPPQVVCFFISIPTIQPPTSQQSQCQQSAQPPPMPNIQPAKSMPGQPGLQDQVAPSQTQPPLRKQHQNQAGAHISAAAVPPASIQSQPTPSHSLQTPQQMKGHLNPPMSLPQSSQLPNVPPVPLHSSSQPHHHQQTHMPMASGQLQQSLQTTGIPHMPLQPRMPQQARPPTLPTLHHQYTPQMGPNAGFQHPGAPQHLSQPIFHVSQKLNFGSLGFSLVTYSAIIPFIFELSSQVINRLLASDLLFHKDSHHTQISCHLNQCIKIKYVHNLVVDLCWFDHLARILYLSWLIIKAGGLHLGSDFSNQVRGSMQADRGSSWMSSQPDNSTLTQLQGPSALVPSQMGSGNQPSRPASLTPEMEKALLQQVMSLTPEQINLLPPEQRNQVLQLQQILRQ
ncbi:hypothetical protein Golob_013022 [Gossypium lobatum]|uniref:Transcription termination and cleavage factor C-terminal domain-containing protein n=1 Tax=Gossypium lobatum TaxID=34289 RepID=A0A7J8LNB5_9ROSI|nr:hypothetical protein [Gossypium lobatum]